MDIFSKTAAGFSKEVDSAMSTFKSTITKLKATAEKAIATKAEKAGRNQKAGNRMYSSRWSFY